MKTIIATSKVNWATTLDCVMKVIMDEHNLFPLGQLRAQLRNKLRWIPKHLVCEVFRVQEGFGRFL